ncbi:arylsulfatase [Chitinophaga niastensis]|nr:arylsulfatase [Chitinophaga niastensis]
MIKKIISRFVLLVLPGLLLISSQIYAQKKAVKKTNIIIIVADDMGFSDLGSFGSEIHTPHLDKLAKNGLIMNQFYNAGRCCPSRAALLTGLYPHQAGVGDMIQDRGYPAYQGYLNDSCATIAELLKTAGYTTIISGKWHVGLVPSAWACNRGFDKSFTLQNNGSSYFNSKPLYNDGRKVTFLLGNKEIVREDTSLYLTQAITNFALDALEEQKNKDNPFFLYVAYNAPHWPLQALPEDIARYKGKYLSGWDTLREKRYEKLMAAGLLKKEWQLSSRYEKVPAWNTLSAKEKESWDTRMAIYAAMIDRMDIEIGKLLDKLKTIKKEENTLIIFLSDNGGSADDVKNWNYVIQKSGTPGSVASIDSYETPWGNVSNTPFRLFKKNMHEGGIATPFIAYFPGVIKAGTINTQAAHVIDIMPTCLNIAGIDYPATFKTRKLKPLEGISLTNAFHNKPFKDHKAICWEHEGSRSIRKGKWKLVAEKGVSWELYDMEKDRTETNNIAQQYPAKVQELQQEYNAWAAKVGVVDLP